MCAPDFSDGVAPRIGMGYAGVWNLPLHQDQDEPIRLGLQGLEQWAHDDDHQRWCRRAILVKIPPSRAK
jgi:hypothetical protein